VLAFYLSAVESLVCSLPLYCCHIIFMPSAPHATTGASSPTLTSQRKWQNRKNLSQRHDVHVSLHMQLHYLPLIHTLLLLQSLTKELVEELQEQRMRDALPSLTSFSRNIAQEIRQTQKQQQQQQQQQQSLIDEGDGVNEMPATPLFPAYCEFARLLPRRSIKYKTSSYHFDDGVSVALQQEAHDDGTMAVFAWALGATAVPANIYIYSSHSPTSASTSPPPLQSHSQSLLPSQLFIKMYFTMPLMASCGHLGSRKASADSNLKYCW
jgi:hypothetical protein